MNRIFIFTTPILIAAVAVALMASVCGKPVNQGACIVDLDCNPDGGSLFRCDQGSGVCLCNNDSACNAGTEYCNPQGYCQERAGCFANDDCERPRFCDVTTGECLDPRNSGKNCSVDTHCPFLYYCNGSTCQPGCRDSSDCPLGYGCVMETCVEGACNTREDCNYGERCVSNNCQSAIDAQTCHDCSTMTGRLTCQGDGNHECLVNQVYDPSDSLTRPEEYCTPKCTNDSDCPWGFGCGDIFTIVSTCSRGQSCPGNQTCQVGSEATTGYCPCLGDSDCPMGTGPCTDDGLCLYSKACGIFPNLRCYDVGVTNP